MEDHFTAIDGARAFCAVPGEAPGSALVLTGANGHVGAMVTLAPDEVRRLRDWLNGHLERHAANLPVRIGD